LAGRGDRPWTAWLRQRYRRDVAATRARAGGGRRRSRTGDDARRRAAARAGRTTPAARSRGAGHAAPATPARAAPPPPPDLAEPAELAEPALELQTDEATAAIDETAEASGVRFPRLELENATLTPYPEEFEARSTAPTDDEPPVDATPTITMPPELDPETPEAPEASEPEPMQIGRA